MQIRRLALVWTAVLVAGCGEPQEKPPVLPTPEELEQTLAGLPFDDFVQRSFEELLRRSPEAVLELGLQSSIDVGHSFLSDASDEFDQQTGAVAGKLLELLQRYDRPALSRQQRITYDVYSWYLDDQVRQRRFADFQYPLNPTLISADLSIQFFFTDAHPLRTPADVEDWLARLTRVPAKLQQVEAALRRRKDKGIVLPRILLNITRGNLQDISQADPRSTPYFTAFAARLEGVEGVDRVRAQARAEQILRDQVKPAYESLDATLAQMTSAAPEGLGLGQFPGGRDAYLEAVRHYVTLAVDPDELEAVGRADLQGLQAEMRARFDQLGYPGTLSLSEGLARATDESGFLPSGNVVAAYQGIIDDAWARLDEAFDLTPTAPVTVIGVPSGGFYVGASLDGTRPGAFYATVAGQMQPRIGMRSLAYHEAVPGHHLQVGIAQDLDQPLFQRLTVFSGYAEGWGLYAERLAAELDWYQGDVHGDIGRLQAEAFRAARLIVDSGIHDRGMTFQQAVTELVNATGYSSSYCQGQIIRYASWPGQAAGYWTGAVKIRGLREQARTELGAGFDLKAFHRAVLSHGSLPLELMLQVAGEDLGLQ